MGDAVKERCGEFYADNLQNLGKYDFCKLPHHGDSNKYLELILNKICPDYCAVTVGDREDVEAGFADKLAKAGAKLYYNCDGDINVTISGGKVAVRQ